MSLRNTTAVALSGPAAIVPTAAAFSDSDLAFCGISISWNPSSGVPTITASFALGSATLNGSNQETAFAPGAAAECQLQMSIAAGTWTLTTPWGTTSGTLTSGQITTLQSFAASNFASSAAGAESILQTLALASSTLCARASGYAQP